MSLSRKAKSAIINKLSLYPLMKERLNILCRRYSIPTSRLFDSDWVRIQAGGVSDPTALAYYRMQREPDFKEAREIVEEVEGGLKYLSEIEKRIIKLEFWTVEKPPKQEIFAEMVISESRYYEHRDSALEVFGRVMGLAHSIRERQEKNRRITGENL